MAKRDAIERRSGGTLMLDETEKRDDGTPVKRLFGYAAKFDNEAVIGGLFREKIKSTAFTRSLQDGDDVVAYFQHGAEPWPIGRRSSGTLRLDADDVGLKFDLDLPDTQAGRDLEVLIRRGDISEMSFAFQPRERGVVWARDNGELPLRELTDVQLFDVSPVVRAAYSGTSVSVRSAETVLSDELEPEDRQEPASTEQDGEQALTVLAGHLVLEAEE